MDEFINSIGSLGASLGLNRVVGQIYALLYTSTQPLSLEDISKKLKISKGGASVNIRIMENWGAVKRVWVPGSRKDYYEANQDTVNIIFNRIKIRFVKTISELNESISIWEKNLENSDEKDKLQNLRKRMSKIKEMKNVVDLIIKSIPSDISGDDLIKKVALIGKLKLFLK